MPCKPEAFALGLVFKLQANREAGNLCYVRMYSGKLKEGQTVYNINKKKRERINRLLRMHANHSQQLDQVEAGDIAVIIGLKTSQTGDTLGVEAFPILLEKMHFPEPVISVAIEPKTLSERKKLGEVLEILALEDPTFSAKENEETGRADHLRHGRAAPGRPGDPDLPGVQGGGPGGKAAGLLSGDHQRRGDARGEIPPHDRRQGAQRRHHHPGEAAPARPGQFIHAQRLPTARCRRSW